MDLILKMHLFNICFTDTHTTVLRPFFRDYPGELVPEEMFFWTLWCKGGYQRQTHWQSGWVPLHRTNQWPISLFPPFFLCQMPFLPQPSQFILPWDRHQICWLAYPVAWLHTQWLGF